MMLMFLRSKPMMMVLWVVVVTPSTPYHMPEKHGLNCTNAWVDNNNTENCLSNICDGNISKLNQMY